MKKIIITLCAALLTLSVSAQDNIKLRTYINPTIGNLLNYADSLGVHIQTICSNYYGIREKSIGFYFGLRNGINHPLTGNEKRDKMIQKLDSISTEQHLKTNLLLDSIRQAFITLADSCRENYIWEYHQNGKDSIYYASALKYFKNKKYSAPIHNRKKDFYNVPEKISFTCTSDSSRGANRTHATIGYCDFNYKYTLDSIALPYNNYIDTKAYWKTIKTIFQKDGIKRHELRISKDSTYTYSDYEVWGGFLHNKGYSSKEKIMIYTMKDKDLANNIIREIIDSTWTHLDKQPDVLYDIIESAVFDVSSINNYSVSYDRIINIKNKENEKKPNHKCFNIQIYNNHIEKEYCFFVCETEGLYFIPQDWKILKSWKNGKKTYNKKLVEQRFFSL